MGFFFLGSDRAWTILKYSKIDLPLLFFSKLFLLFYGEGSIDLALLLALLSPMWTFANEAWGWWWLIELTRGEVRLGLTF